MPLPFPSALKMEKRADQLQRLGPYLEGRVKDLLLDIIAPLFGRSKILPGITNAGLMRSLMPNDPEWMEVVHSTLKASTIELSLSQGTSIMTLNLRIFCSIFILDKVRLSDN